MAGSHMYPPHTRTYKKMVISSFLLNDLTLSSHAAEGVRGKAGQWVRTASQSNLISMIGFNLDGKHSSSDRALHLSRCPPLSPKQGA